MRLKAAIEGNLKKHMKAEFATAEKAVTMGIKETTTGLKLAMRRQVHSSGLGQRMANTWRGDVYPRSQNSIRAAGLVYTKASKIMAGLMKVQLFVQKMDGGLPYQRQMHQSVAWVASGSTRVIFLNIVLGNCVLFTGAMDRLC